MQQYQLGQADILFDNVTAVTLWNYIVFHALCKQDVFSFFLLKAVV